MKIFDTITLCELEIKRTLEALSEIKHTRETRTNPVNSYDDFNELRRFRIFSKQVERSMHEIRKLMRSPRQFYNSKLEGK